MKTIIVKVRTAVGRWHFETEGRSTIAVLLALADTLPFGAVVTVRVKP